MYKNADEARKNNVMVVDDLWQVELMRDFILKKRNSTFQITNLMFTEGGQCLISLLSMPVNRQYPELHIQEEAVVLTTEGWSRPVSRYCEELLNVEVEGEESLANLYKEIYKVGKGSETRFAIADDKGVYRNVVNDEVIAKEDIFTATGDIKDNVIQYNKKGYGALTCTSGQLKRYNITLVANNLPSFDAAAVWNKVTYGCADILCDGSSVKPKEIAQANTRLSAFRAPSCPIAKVKTFAVFMGKMTFQMIKGGKEYRDGFGFLSSEFLAEGLSSLEPDRYYFAPWCCDGLAVQCRPWLNKIMAEVTRRAYINEVISHWLLQTVILERGKISAEDAAAFILGVKSKGKKGKFAGKVVVICDKTEDAWAIDLFTDLNGLKAPFDPNTESDLEALDVSHTEHEIEQGSRTSTQLLQTLMIADPSATMAFVERIADNWIAQKEEQLTSDVGRAPSWMDFQSKYDCQQMISSISPAFAHKHYAPLWHSVVDGMFKGYVTGIGNLNIPTKGSYFKIVPDTAADFGVRILGVNKNYEIEVVADVAEQNGIERFVGVKYPKQGAFEYLRARVITKAEYITRVTAHPELTPVQKKLISDHVYHLSGGILMIPAIETIKNMLAGLDFDGDGLSGFFDEELVEIVWNIIPRAVIIDENDVTVHDAYDEALG